MDNGSKRMNGRESWVTVSFLKIIELEKENEGPYQTNFQAIQYNTLQFMDYQAIEK